LRSLKIIFMGSPIFSLPSLDLLYLSSHRLEALVTQPDKPGGRGRKIRLVPAGQWAQKHQVELVQPLNMKDQNYLAWLNDKRPDLIVTVAFGRILPPEILHLPALGCINLHASYLPAYRGAAPIHRAVIDGAEHSGVSVIELTRELDAGDIIMQEKEPLSPYDTAGMLHDRLAVRGASLLLKAVNALADGTAERTPQDPEQVSYAPSLSPEDERLDWTLSPLELYNRVRGLNPWPGAYTIFRGRRIKVWLAAKPEEGQTVSTAQPPGTVIYVGDDSLAVAAGKGGVLKILELQPEGKRKMDAGSFCCGYRLEAGQRLDGEPLP